MTAYLWLAIFGLISFSVGAIGHLWTSKTIEVKHEVQTFIHYTDREKGWLRTWVDYSGDAEEFWREHKIVPKEK